MSLPLDVTLLVLLAALMHATWNALAKSGRSKLLDITAMALAGGIVSMLALPFVPALDVRAWPWLAGSVALHFAYFVGLMGAYRWGELSQVYPLMRGVAPVLVAISGSVLLDDKLSANLWTGIVLISLGLLGPLWLQRNDHSAARKGTWFALANVVFITGYTLVDGTGARLAGSALSYTLWLSVLDPLPILALSLVRHSNGMWIHLKQHWLRSAIGGVLSVAGYSIVLWAMTRAPIAAVAALRETSVIFAALIGALLLHERFGHARIAGAALVALGIVAVRL